MIRSRFERFPLKSLLLFFAVLLAAGFIWAGWFILRLPSVEELKSSRANLSILVRDWQGKEHPFTVGPKNPRWTPLGQISDDMKWAVIVAEDASFYQHDGVDLKALKEAIRYDLKEKRLARGASTITQQVAKNLFLSREKTITRKLKELVLAKRMEEELSKGRILELYLNIVELGPMVYGVGHASRYYFSKPPSDLTPRESAFLAAMLPGPRVAFNPYRNLGRVEKRTDRILNWMHQRGILSEEEWRLALEEELNIAGLQKKVAREMEKGPPPPEEENPEEQGKMPDGTDVPPPAVTGGGDPDFDPDLPGAVSVTPEDGEGAPPGEDTGEASPWKDLAPQ